MICEFDCLSKESSFEGYTVLEASAGSGKTFAIEQIFTRLLIEKETPIQKILVVTFTRAATSELKQRIRHNIERVLDVLHSHENSIHFSYLEPFLLDEKKLQRAKLLLEEALHCFDEAQIFTIHGFCARMLSEYFFNAHIFIKNDANEIFDDDVAKNMVRATLNDLVDQKFLTPGQIKFFTESYESEKELFQKALLKKTFSENSFFSANALLEKINQFLLSHDFCEDTLVTTLMQISKHYLKTEFVAEDKLKIHIPKLIEIFHRRSLMFEEMDLLIFYWKPMIFSLQKKKVFQNKNFEQIEALKEKLLPLVHSAADLEVIFSLFQEKFLKIWESFLIQEGIFSFDLILDYMAKALSQPTFLQAIQKRYQAVMIDEFQDTDAVQWDIFERLFVKKRFLLSFLIIGDPKQSIYRFRKADLYSFIKAKEVLGEKNYKILRTNYRSTPSLVRALNTLFQSDTPWLTLPKLGQAILYQPALAKTTEKPENFSDKKKLSCHFILSDEDESLLLEHVAHEIFYLHQTQGIFFQNIAVLVKDRYQAKRIEDFFSQYNIPCINQTYTSLLEKNSTIAFKALLEGVLKPFDPVHCAKIWLGDFFQSKESLQLDVESFSFYLEKIQKAWEKNGVSGLYGAFFKEKWENISLMERQEEKFQEIQDLFELLAIYFQSHPKDDEHLLLFFDWLKEREFFQQKGGDVKNIQNEDAVQILTIHMSKGLEFDVVFPLGVSEASSSDRFLSDEELQETEAEKFRQFYVALTRAKEQLYIPIFFLKEKRQKKESALIELFLKKRMPNLCFSLEDYLPQFERWAEDKIMSFEVIKRSSLQRSVHFSLPLKKTKKHYFFDSALLRKPEEKIYSFSSLKHHHEEFLEKKGIHNPNFATSKEKLPASSTTGKMFHEIFEEIFKKNYLKAPKHVVEKVVCQKTQKYFLEEAKEIVLDMVLFYLYTSLVPFDFSLKDLECKECFPECEFFFWEAKVAFMKGYMDLLFSYKNYYFLLDWKSNWLGDSKESYQQNILETEMVEKEYDLQAALYTDALNRTDFFHGKKFGGAFYIFIRGILSDTKGIYHFYPEAAKVKNFTRQDGLLWMD